MNGDRELFLAMLRRTRLGASKTMNIGSQRMDGGEKLMAKLEKIGLSLSQNRDKVSRFCQQELQKSKTKIETECFHDLQTIKVFPNFNDSFSYFRKQKSERHPVDFTYLKCKEHLYIFDHAFIPKTDEQLSIAFILSQSRMENIFTYVQLCVHFNRLIRIFTTVTLWRRILALLEIFFGASVFQLIDQGTVMLFEEEKAGSFDFQTSILIFNRNLWTWDSFKVFIIIKGVKYVIKGPGIDEEETIYAAWRKDIIDEPQYCRLIDKELKSDINWSNFSHGSQAIRQNCNHFSTRNAKLFNNFSNCELWTQLDPTLIKEIYLCGEIVEYIEGQVLYKALTILDRFFVVLEGIVGVEVEGKEREQLTVSGFFCLASLTSEIETIRSTLKVISKGAVVFSMPLWKLKYVLGHEIQKLKDIEQEQIETFLQSKEWKEVKLSQWMLKNVKYDVENSRSLSDHTTKRIGAQKIKISTRLWKKICDKDLGIVYLTQSQEPSQQN